MNIVIPMAGVGSRLKPHTLTTPKPLTLIAGKSIVQRLVEDIVKVIHQEVNEIAFVIGPIEKGFGSDVKNQLLKTAKDLGAKGSVYVQEEPLGVAHAIQCAKSALVGPCVIAFADTLFKADFSLDVNADSVVWVKQVKDPSAFGVVQIVDGAIVDFVEKPTEFVSDLAIIGIYYFKEGKLVRDQIQYLLDNNIKDRGEFQFTDALEGLRKKGLKFVPGKVEEWMDCGNKTVTVETNSKVLELTKEKRDELISKDVVLENSQIVEPCFIGKNVILKNTTIGPYVSIGENSEVKNSTLKNSLIQSNVKIENANLSNAMIGHYAKYNGDFTSISIGDYSELI